ncbi:MAG: AAA family ATPase [Oscillospiraceae bacterium]|nr:AAA family ATPase [Oscillospiraceae bacterium]
MKILSMTATFGKLSNETLTLKPGLNVIHAPNEWGKSTWCAFLVAMLYGIDTRERSTQSALADKERYAPWSGQEMSGRMDIIWNDRKITIERGTKGRTPFGNFRAYETENGLPVPELTAANCGETLLGVEKSVFVRTGFLKLADLPVTQDEALRRRLNALVTTGDESNAGDALAQKLKDLKNRCRHNKTGLIPQAEAQRNALSDSLAQLRRLQEQSQGIRLRQRVLEQNMQLLENHQTALAYEAAQKDAQRVDAAQQERRDAHAALEALEQACRQLPTRQETEEQLRLLEILQLRQSDLEKEVLPEVPQPPTPPAPFGGMDAEQALQQAKSDKAAFEMLSKPLSPVLPILAGLFLAAAIGIAFIAWYASPVLLLFSGIFFFAHIRGKTAQARDRKAISNQYPGLAPQQWVDMATAYWEDSKAFTQACATRDALLRSQTQKSDALNQDTRRLTGGAPIFQSIAQCRKILSTHDELRNAQIRYEQASKQAIDLAAMAKPSKEPAFPDTLTLSKEETIASLADAGAELRLLHQNLGSCQGQMNALGQEETLSRSLEQVNSRIRRLEDTYSALNLAIETLAEASAQLQRRFAPRISQRAQELFGTLTGNRYDRLQLTKELHLHAGAQGENTLRPALWRSEGTVDQLYLALRLAVSGELTPHAPLVLDDALVRFDDTRLALAMDILKEESGQKQVIVFTCQGRETNYLENPIK